MAERNLNSPPPPRQRCFVAMPVAAACARRLAAAWRDAGLPGWRAVPDANQHLTLLFLGSVDADAARSALRAVAALDGHGVLGEATHLVGLPRPARATVAALSLRPDPCWSAWRAALAAALGSPGAGSPAAGFRPHITVARRRQGVRLPDSPLARPLAVQLGAPRLFRSVSTRSGVRYEAVSEADV